MRLAHITLVHIPLITDVHIDGFIYPWPHSLIAMAHLTVIPKQLRSDEQSGDNDSELSPNYGTL